MHFLWRCGLLLCVLILNNLLHHFGDASADALFAVPLPIAACLPLALTAQGVLLQLLCDIAVWREVALVCHHLDYAVFRRHFSELICPLLNFLEALEVRHIVNEQRSMSALVVMGCEGFKSLLTSSVP